MADVLRGEEWCLFAIGKVIFGLRRSQRRWPSWCSRVGVKDWSASVAEGSRRSRRVCGSGLGAAKTLSGCGAVFVDESSADGVSFDPLAWTDGHDVAGEPRSFRMMGRSSSSGRSVRTQGCALASLGVSVAVSEGG